VAVALAIALDVRAGAWSSGVAIWSDAAEKSPGKARVHANLGNVRHARRDFAGALESYRRALALGGRTLVTPIVVHNMATSFLALGRPGDARDVLFRLERPEPETLVLLAFAALEGGDPAEAARWAARAVDAAPASPRAHEAAGRVSLERGDLQAARASYLRAVMLFPSDPTTLLALGRIEARLGNAEAACRAFRHAVASPGNPWAARWAASEAAALRCP
jgi:Flp pilus assembly protein TadD